MSKMPLISTSIIESIREQTHRKDGKGYEQYCNRIMAEIKEENPNLWEAIMHSLTLFRDRFSLDTENSSDDLLMMINILNLVTSVYQSIKQQIICNELEDVS